MDDFLNQCPTLTKLARVGANLNGSRAERLTVFSERKDIFFVFYHKGFCVFRSVGSLLFEMSKPSDGGVFALSFNTNSENMTEEDLEASHTNLQ